MFKRINANLRRPCDLTTFACIWGGTNAKHIELILRQSCDAALRLSVLHSRGQD